MKLEIQIDRAFGLWRWVLIEFSLYDQEVCCGTSPDYDEACRMAKIAWEQHSEGDK